MSLKTSSVTCLETSCLGYGLMESPKNDAQEREKAQEPQKKIQVAKNYCEVWDEIVLFIYFYKVDFSRLIGRQWNEKNSQ